MKDRLLGFLLGLSLVAGCAIAADWYEASGAPVARSTMSSAVLRTEFTSIDTDIADKLPVLTGNGSKIVAVNSGGTALEALSTGVPVASGGTGSTTAAAARTALGLAIATDVQAFDTELTEIAALANTDSNFIVGNGAAWVAESGATARASMGANSAANLTTGELPDARLSANVPLLNAANAFTATQTISHTTPTLALTETDATADEGKWRLLANADTFLGRVYNDAESVIVTFLTIARTGTAVDSVNFATTALQTNGVDITGATGTFEATWATACTTTPSQTWNYAVIGNMVTLRMVDTVSCTSDSTSFGTTSADVPAAIRPAGHVYFLSHATDNGSGTKACFQITTAGVMNMLIDTGAGACFSASWTASGSKGFLVYPNSFSYILN